MVSPWVCTSNFSPELELENQLHQLPSSLGLRIRISFIVLAEADSRWSPSTGGSAMQTACDLRGQNMETDAITSWNILNSSIPKQCLDCGWWSCKSIFAHVSFNRRPPLWQRGPPPRRGLRFHRLAGCEDVSVVESDWLILLVVLWIPYSLCIYIYIYMSIHT